MNTNRRVFMRVVGPVALGALSLLPIISAYDDRSLRFRDTPDPDAPVIARRPRKVPPAGLCAIPRGSEELSVAERARWQERLDAYHAKMLALNQEEIALLSRRIEERQAAAGSSLAASGSGGAAEPPAQERETAPEMLPVAEREAPPAENKTENTAENDAENRAGNQAENKAGEKAGNGEAGKKAVAGAITPDSAFFLSAVPGRDRAPPPEAAMEKIDAAREKAETQHRLDKMGWINTAVAARLEALHRACSDLSPDAEDAFIGTAHARLLQSLEGFAAPGEMAEKLARQAMQLAQLRQGRLPETGPETGTAHLAQSSAQSLGRASDWRRRAGQGAEVPPYAIPQR